MSDNKHWNGPTIKGVKREWARIKWPKGATAAKETALVIILSAVVSLGIVGIDNAVLAVFNMFI